jgi:predicted phosphodiesterase
MFHKDWMFAPRQSSTPLSGLKSAYSRISAADNSAPRIAFLLGDSLRAEIMRRLFARPIGALADVACLVFLLCLFVAAFPSSARAQITIAQISDTHLGESHAPHAAENARRIVDMVNSRHPDAVILSGDIGENPEEWQRARNILKGLHAPLYYAPGNHDVHSNDVRRYRAVFGPDYYRFQVKGVNFIVIDSQLLGNYDDFNAQPLPPMSPQDEAEGQKMLSWLAQQRQGADNRGRHGWSRGKDRDNDHDQDRDDRRDGDRDRDNDDRGGKIVIGIQHIPLFRGNNLPADPKPYWVINEPYRSRELDLLHKLGIRHMLVGHWHVGAIFEHDGIVWHVAPSTSRPLQWSDGLGFAMHTISRDGDVKTEFIRLNAEP